MKAKKTLIKRKVLSIAITHCLEKVILIEVHCSAVSVFFESTTAILPSEQFITY